MAKEYKTEVYRYRYDNDTVNKMLEMFNEEAPWVVNGIAGRRLVDYSLAETEEEASLVYHQQHENRTL